MIWILIVYYIIGLIVYIYRANKYWGYITLLPFAWVAILALAFIWPIALVIDYFEEKKLSKYEQGNCNCNADISWPDFYGEEPFY